VETWFTERNILLFAHIAAAIMLLGPTTLATSLFPRYATAEGLPVARVLHRVSRGYGAATLAVPGIGFILAQRVGYLEQGWVVASLMVFVVAFFLLVVVILPGQMRMLDGLASGGVAAARDLGMVRGASGLFGLAWVVVLFLMVAKPS
jgi:hypothetical protein